MDLQQLFSQALAQDKTLWILVLSFVGGVVSSLLPCTLGMLPILIGYMGAYGADSRKAMLLQGALFTLGVAVVMSVLGLLATTLGMTFGSWIGSELYLVMGLIAMVLGIHMLGWVHIPFPSFIKQLPAMEGKGRYLAPLVLGMAFGATASPCGTPYLAAILGVMAYEQNLWLGGISLFLYALGQGSILIVAGLFTGMMKHTAKLREIGGLFNTLSGALFALFGVLLVLYGLGVIQVGG